MNVQSGGRFATSLILTGLILALMSLGGGWGEAYGQTAGPTPTPSGPILSVSKTVDTPTPQPGDIITFTIRVQNIGDASARTIVVRDTLPGTLTIVNATATLGVVRVTGQVVTVTLEQLDPGVTMLVTIAAQVRNTARGSIRNTVVVRYATSADSVAGEVQAVADVAVSAAAEDAAADDPARSGSSQLSATGGDAGLRWPLFLTGLIFLTLGGVALRRSRTAA